MVQVCNEAALENALETLYQKWGRMGFWAKRLHQKFTPGRKRYIGGIAAARSVLAGGTDGFAFLREHDCLQLSVEALILKPEWQELFGQTDRALAQKRLDLARK
jgi:hypothetical protein